LIKRRENELHVLVTSWLKAGLKMH